MIYWGLLKLVRSSGQVDELQDVSELTVKRVQKEDGTVVTLVFKNGEPVHILELTEDEIARIVFGGE